MLIPNILQAGTGVPAGQTCLMDMSTVIVEWNGMAMVAMVTWFWTRVGLGDVEAVSSRVPSGH